MMRYLPPNGTAGLARSRVSGWSRVPCPPAITSASVLIGTVSLVYSPKNQPAKYRLSERPSKAFELNRFLWVDDTIRTCKSGSSYKVQEFFRIPASHETKVKDTDL